MRNVAMFLLGAAVLVGAVGCPGVIGPSGPAILAGDWTGTDADGLVVTVTFNEDGIVVSIAREDGVSAEVSNSTTELDGNDVTIVIGGATFSGTLSEDQNTITGTIEQEITAGGGDVVITLPAGDFEIDRVVEDLCEGNTCDDGDACNGVETCDADTGDCVAGTPVECGDGETCVDGDCVGADPCEGNTCDDGDACNGVETCDAETGDCVDGTPVECAERETCVDGDCVAGDPCEGNTCDDGDACNGVETCDSGSGDCVAGTPVVCADGESCVDGDCVAADPCDGVTCADCETCVDGTCELLVGDAAAGETYFAAEGCQACHGPDGEGPPSVIGVDCQEIFNHLTGVEPHTGGTRDITGQDAADLEAWLAP